MNIYYRRMVATAVHHEESVTIPKGSIIRRVECHVVTLPPVAAGSADTASCTIDFASLVEDDAINDSTWLFGQESLNGHDPVVWQGKLTVKKTCNAKVWVYFVGVTVGNQLEITVTCD